MGLKKPKNGKNRKITPAKIDCYGLLMPKKALATPESSTGLTPNFHHPISGV